MRRFSLLSIAVLFSFSGMTGAIDLSVVSEADRQKIQEALPDTAPATPAKPRKLLVFTLARGFVHGSIPYGALAFQLMGKKTHAYTATISDDIAMFEPETLNQFDAVVMVSTTGDLFTPPGIEKLSPAAQQRARQREKRLKQSFLDFIRSGHGLVGVHAATDCCYRWSDYGDLIGAYFWGHPWHEDVAIKLDDPGHPLCRVFDGHGFHVTDEIYQFRAPYSRDKLRVLLSLDTQHTNMDKGDRIHRTDGDFAVSWVRSYGKGRVFYCSLGHRNEIFWNPTLMRYYLAGIQFAFGDLSADTTPSVELTAAYLKDSQRRGYLAGLTAAFADIASFKLGQDPSAARLIDNLVIDAQQPGNEEKARMLVHRLVGLLTADTTPDCKVYACRKLRILGTDEAIPALRGLLTDPELSDVARYALASIPGKAADQALLAALSEVHGKLKAGIIGSLGARRVEEATPRLTPLLDGPDAGIAQAAAGALGALGTAVAAQALLAARAKTAGATRLAVDHALLACAARMSDESMPSRVQIYGALYRSAAPENIRAAAFHGLLLARGAAAVPQVLTALHGPRNAFSEAAAGVVAELPGSEAATRFAAELPRLPVANQPLVIQALVERGDRRVTKALIPLLSAHNEQVQLAAARAMETLGDENAVLPLVKIAATAQEGSPLRRQARQSLERMNAPGVDARLAALVPDADTAVRGELVRLLGARNVRNAVPLLIKTANDSEKTVRQESFRALDRVAQSGDLPALTTLLVQTRDNERGILEDTVVSLAARIPDPADRPLVVEQALRRDLSTEARCSLLSVLGRIASPASLPTLYAALNDNDEEVQKAALRALADWPDPAPMAKLRELSRTSPNKVVRVLALRGYARQLAMPANRSMKRTLQLYAEALSLAQGDQEKKTLLSGIGALRHPSAMKLLEPYLNDKAYQAEAFVAAAQILEAMDGGAMKLTASRDQEHVHNAIDGDRATRWTTGRPMKPGDWFQIDLGYDTDIETVMLDAGPIGNDYPRSYELYVSADGKEWGVPVVTGKGAQKIFTIKLPPTHGRYLKIVQTGSSPGNFWSISELRVNGVPRLVGKGDQLDRSTWKVSASSSGGTDVAERAIDGDPKTRWTSGRSQTGGEWFIIDLGKPTKILKLLLDAGSSSMDFPKAYEVYISTDGKNWLGPVAKGVGTSARTSITLLPREGRYLKIVQTGRSDHWFWSIHELYVWGGE